MVCMRHQLTVNTVATLLDTFEQKLQIPVTITPAVSQTDLEKLEEVMETDSRPVSSRKEKRDEGRDEGQESRLSALAEAPDTPPSLFVTQLLLESNQLIFHPNRDDFLACMETVISSVETTVKSVDNLVDDEYFSAFTR